MTPTPTPTHIQPYKAQTDVHTETYSSGENREGFFSLWCQSQLGGGLGLDGASQSAPPSSTPSYCNHSADVTSSDPEIHYLQAA